MSVESQKHILHSMIELSFKEDVSTLHLIIPSGGLVQGCFICSLWIVTFPFCIHPHSCRVSFARLTMRVGEVSVASHSLVLQLFHKIQRVIVVRTC